MSMFAELLCLQNVAAAIVEKMPEHIQAHLATLAAEGLFPFHTGRQAVSFREKPTGKLFGCHAFDDQEYHTAAIEVDQWIHSHATQWERAALHEIAFQP